jgi:hypothetical protein
MQDPAMLKVMTIEVSIGDQKSWKIRRNFLGPR